MIGAYFQPLAEDSSLAWTEAATGTDCASSIGSPFDATNNVPRILSPATLPKPTRVDAGIEFAMTHYEDLLRRLAD